MITMPKGTLQQLMFILIGLQDEGTEDYARMCDILLTMFGVVTPAGELSATYATSPFWTLDGDVLRPSSVADIAVSVLGDDMGAEHVGQVMRTLGMDETQSEQFRDYLALVGASGRAVERR